MTTHGYNYSSLELKRSLLSGHDFFTSVTFFSMQEYLAAPIVPRGAARAPVRLHNDLQKHSDRLLRSSFFRTALDSSNSNASATRSTYKPLEKKCSAAWKKCDTREEIRNDFINSSEVPCHPALQLHTQALPRSTAVSMWSAARIWVRYSLRPNKIC